jgi:hypothetical protein
LEESSESESSEENDYSSTDTDSEIHIDAEYRQFIANYGHLDFRYLMFLPKIKSN